MQILRAAHRVATPWKNGLGVTREIAAHPPGAGLDDFDWRISMATVGAGGPFSIFPGVDRILAVLEGRLSLSLDGAAPIEFSPASPPFAFPGDVPVHADLLAGPVTDLNVMTRRGRVQATVERMPVDAPVEIVVSRTTVIVAQTAGVALTHQAVRYALDSRDAIVFDQEAVDGVRLEPRQPSILFIIRLNIGC